MKKRRVQLAVSTAIVMSVIVSPTIGYGDSKSQKARRAHKKMSVSQVKHGYERLRSQQLSTVAKTQGLLADKLQLREAEVKHRLRALYKLSRSSWPRLWLQPKTRHDVARWLGAARRIYKRDKRELTYLREEITIADAAQESLEGAQLAKNPEIPELRSLPWPGNERTIVAAYGEFRPTKRVRLMRRGIEIAAVVDEPIRSIDAGQVLYVGAISGLGQAVLIEHRGYISVLGHLKSIRVQAGEELESETIVAVAATEKLYLEMRISIGSIGYPVNPTAFLAQ